MTTALLSLDRPAARALGADAPLPLHELTGSWQVRTGFVDLFAVRLVDGHPAGRREFLQRIPAGAMLFGLPDAVGSLGVLAVGGLDTWIAPGPGEPGLAAGIDGWIAGMADLLAAPDAPGWPDGTAAAGGASLAAGQRLGGRGRQILWALVIDGRLAGIAGATAGPGDPPLPVVAAAPVRALSPCRLDLVPTAALVADGGIEAALAMFHHAVLVGIDALVGQRRRRLEGQAGQREDVSRAVLAEGISALAGLAADLPAPHPKPSDPAFAAVRAVAGALGETVVPPAESPGESAMSGGHGGLAAAIAGCGLRSRVVLLRDGWWREDHGPLLATVEATGAPVALLRGRRGYRLWNPDGNQDMPVTAAVARTLADGAWMLYRRLPDDPVDLWGFVRFGLHGAAGDVVRLLGLGLAGAVLGLFAPMAMGLLVETAIPAAARDQVAVLAAGLVAAAVGAASFQVVRSLLLVRLEGRMDLILQVGLFDRLLRLPVSFFQRFNAGDLGDRVLAVRTIRQMLTGAAASTVLGSLFSVVNLFVLFYYSVPLAFLAVILAALSMAVTAGLALAQLHGERDLAMARGRVEGLVLQLVTGIAKLKAAAAEDRALGVWAKIYAVQKRHFLAAQRFANLQEVFQAGFVPLVTAVIFLAVSWAMEERFVAIQLRSLVDPGGAGAASAMGLGSFLAFNAAFGQFQSAMNLLATTLGGLLGAVPVYERTRPLLEARPETDGPRRPPGLLGGAIEFSHVSFAYGSDGPPVIRDLSFSIQPGEFVALAGPSGSGKSTILRLLLGFEAPGEGEILYDGRPLSGLDAAALRRQIGVVLQNGRIMPGSILVNIAGSSGATLEDSWEAARLAGLDADIRSMPMGMHTVLTDGGTTLSGGQCQRLMIARALVRKPRMLFLDEATSALDNRTQSVVTETLSGLNITRVVIAHRLSTVEKVDRLLVIDGGRLVQSGAFAELAGRPGLFAELAERQRL